MMQPQTKKKKPSTANLSYVIILILMVIIVILFVLVTFASHSQLGTEFTSPKVFVYNNLKKFGIDNIKIPEFPRPHLIDTEAHHIFHPPEDNKIGHLIDPHHSSHEDNHFIDNHVEQSSEKESQHPPVDNSDPFDYDFPSHQLTCPNKELVQFWKRPTKADIAYESPYLHVGPREKYVTFEPDVGGWNNIRMQMELVLVFAFATGRTLVLPPDQPMYLLNAGKGHQKAHSFADFFPFEYIAKRMKVISMEEFMVREGVRGQLHRKNAPYDVMYPPQNKTYFDATIREEKLAMWYYLRNVSSCPMWKCMTEFLVIPDTPQRNYTYHQFTTHNQARYHLFASNRTANYFDPYWQEQKVIHFISMPGLDLRLLEHFYTYLFFENESLDRYYKRFVRDYIHYMDDIFCKGAMIIAKLKEESHNGKFSTFHIRRGEFQYKVVKLPASKILSNIGSFLPKNQLVYVATDERNKSFFDAFRSHFPQVKFLDDYMDVADLRSMNPNYLGMIDQIICSRGDYFVGTWFSTFTGYITRMRGYLGYSDKTVFFGDKEHRDRFQKHENPKFPFYMREWNNSWHDIDII